MAAMAAQWPVLARHSLARFGSSRGKTADAYAWWPPSSLPQHARSRHSRGATTTIAAAAPWEQRGAAAAATAAPNEDEQTPALPMRADLRVVLYRPQIPQNAGNVARTCAATGVPLKLVTPMGFKIDDAKLKRAGLDYWSSVCARVYGGDDNKDDHDAGWRALLAEYDAAPGPKRLVAFTVYGASHYAGPAFAYRPGDWLLFGSETEGLSARAHDDVLDRKGALVKIPMRGGARSPVRSLNLATSVGIGVFEALRQLDLEAGGGGGGPAAVVEPRDDELWRETPMARARRRGGGGGGGGE